VGSSAFEVLARLGAAPAAPKVRRHRCSCGRVSAGGRAEAVTVVPIERAPIDGRFAFTIDDEENARGRRRAHCEVMADGHLRSGHSISRWSRISSLVAARWTRGGRALDHRVSARNNRKDAP